MTQHISENANKNKKTKLTIIIAGIVAIALVLTAVGAFWFIKQNSRVVAARKQCEIKVAQLTKASNTWKSLATNSLLVKLAKTDSKQGRELKKTLEEKVPEAVYCTSNSPEELGSKSAEALASSAWYTTEAQRVRKLAIALLKATGEYKEDDSTTKDKDKAKDKAKDKKEAEKKKEDLAKKEKEIQQATNNVIRDANTTPRRQQAPVNPQPQQQPKQQPKQQTPQKETPQHKTPQNTKPAENKEKNGKENKENKDKNGEKDKNTPEKKKAKTDGETINTEEDNKNKQGEKDKNDGNNNENKGQNKQDQHEQDQHEQDQHEQDQHEQDQNKQSDNK
ncbi:ATPase [Gardnerella vaginalis]|uniref:ATPase n=1 Tax=Gardnerella vaginalis TaxID=2702 RepID=UPI0039EE5FF7